MLTNEQVLKIAGEAHRGQFRKDAKTPYIEHPKAVAEILKNKYNIEYCDKIIQIAYLHDVLEDTDITSELLCEMGVSLKVINCVVTLTHSRSESYIDYILRIKQLGGWARIVKIADLTHNLNDLQAGSLRDKYMLAKYILEN